MSGSRRSNNGSSVRSPSRPTASPAADNSHLQQQHQQQYHQQLMYGMPLSSQPVHTTAAAASSTAATATATLAATTAAAAVTSSSTQLGQQSNFVPTGSYQYQGAYQPTNLQQRVNAAVLSLNQMFPTPMSLDGSSYQHGQMPQGSDGSNNSFSFVPAGQGQQAPQGSQVPSLYQLQSADGTGNYLLASANPTKIKTTMPFNGQDFYTWSFEFELLVQTTGFWQSIDGTALFPSHGSPLQQATFRSASLTAYTVLVSNLTPTEQLGIRPFCTSAAPAKAAWLYLQGVHMAKDTVNQSKILAQMINGEKVMQYINRARNLRDQLQKCGGYFPDAMFHTVLLAGSKGVHGAMGEGMGSEEGDGGAGGHGGMFYHVGEACSEDMVVPASKVALHRSSHWVINTGAFMTMTNQEDLLDEVRPSKAATVVSPTGQVVPVRGEGRAMFMGADGRLVGLKRVLLVPGLCANLLSTKVLSEAGLKMEMMGTKVFKATLDGRVLWDLRGGKDMHRSMWEIPVLPWKEAAARLAAEAVREGHASHVTSGGGGDGSDGGLLVHGGGALPSVTPST
ncbi:unnamed protein product, partial [Closterium sp. NIES-54]